MQFSAQVCVESIEDTDIVFSQNLLQIYSHVLIAMSFLDATINYRGTGQIPAPGRFSMNLKIFFSENALGSHTSWGLPSQVRRAFPISRRQALSRVG